ncbi:MAG: cation transporter [Spirochaetales bacterium]|nr:cation transporter [Spirochaetales bacterium]
MNKKKLGLAEGAVSSIVNIVLFVLKLWVGLAVGSVAMAADAWHTLSDTFTSLVIILGFIIGAKPEDAEHPFGHGRAELVGAMVIGTLLAVVGINFFADSVVEIRAGESRDFSKAAIIVFALSAIIKEALAQFSLWAGKKTNSRALRADGWHHRSDAIASAVIVASSFAANRLPWMDGVLGTVVSLLILYAAYEILRDVTKQLLGEGVSSRMRQRISSIITDEAAGPADAHHMHIHRYGDHIEATMHVSLPNNYTLDEAHLIADKIEERLRKELGIEPTIHLEPSAQGSAQH